MRDGFALLAVKVNSTNATYLNIIMRKPVED